MNKLLLLLLPCSLLACEPEYPWPTDYSSLKEESIIVLDVDDTLYPVVVIVVIEESK